MLLFSVPVLSNYKSLYPFIHIIEMIRYFGLQTSTKEYLAPMLVDTC